jgi:carboxyl-terminal processing protease
MRVIIIVIITIVLGVTIVFAKSIPKDSDKQKNVKTEERGFMSNLSELKEISEIMDVIRDNFVGEKPVTKEDLLHGAIKGMTESLGDPHTNYFSKEDMKSFTEDIKGEYVGVGMVVSKKEKVLEVVSPIEDTPAYKAGMRSKDLIIEIEGKSTTEMTLEKCVENLKGVANTKVKILVYREGVSKPFEVTLTRAVIKLKYVKYKMLGDDIGYLRLTQFGEKVSIDMRKAAKDLIEAQKAKGIILDLRNNPGGSLQEAVAISSIFIDTVKNGEKIEKAKIVSIKDKAGNEEVYRSMAGKDFKSYPEIPIIVLINEGSASASEIVSGAIKDLKRGILLGEKTYGKGSVQNLLPLKDGDGIKLTIAKYYTPSGVSIDKKGIEPDVKVEEENDREFFDGFVTNIEFKETEKTTTEKAVTTTESGIKTEKKKEDKQLNMAIGILKGLILYKK